MPSPEYSTPDHVMSLRRHNCTLRLENAALRATVTNLERVILEMNTIAQAGLLAIKQSDQVKRDLGLPEANPLNDSEVL